MAYLYWIYDKSCIRPKDHGYIGASIDAKRRFKHHQKRRFGRRGIKMKILFEGTIEECWSREARLRPYPGIGWNIYNGGRKSLNASKEFCHWLSHRLKGRKITWGDKISKTLKGRKGAPRTEKWLHNLSLANKNNPKVKKNLDRARKIYIAQGVSEETRQKMRDAWTPERKRKQFTPEVIQNMKNAQRKRRRWPEEKIV
jgi:hypothetical protein